ncbi:hypothetical protein F443_02039 [Phytophthora nicotianae P1569]|uniref:Uncharacterized protein n=1 Tax=Phytophthora nicotianae P1569 TaxID=1317065 RepID=V9FWZ6_PHYNI|nr:hypothetical protein F443_02039 [Phytophthora nicotianae P1569]
MALYGVYWYKRQHKQVLLAIAPVEEGDLMVQPLIKKISQISHPSELNLSFLIGNNCATNQAAATLVNSL